MKFGVVNKSTTVNRFFLHTLQRNITHLAVITHKTNKDSVFWKGGTGKEPIYIPWLFFFVKVDLMAERRRVIVEQHRRENEMRKSKQEELLTLKERELHTLMEK